ncbi:MAG: hypothetical protein CM1200mP39_26110 [Dehalococcoidia bacterium]|nr:MAG: hypothetical protein CM1200mP39_26110 [Dehalococcoidia bacterium]
MILLCSGGFETARILCNDLWKVRTKTQTKINPSPIKSPLFERKYFDTPPKFDSVEKPMSGFNADENDIPFFASEVLPNPH